MFSARIVPHSDLNSPNPYSETKSEHPKRRAEEIPLVRHDSKLVRVHHRPPCWLLAGYSKTFKLFRRMVLYWLAHVFVANAVHAANPNAKVIAADAIGDLSTKPRSWLKRHAVTGVRTVVLTALRRIPVTLSQHTKCCFNETLDLRSCHLLAPVTQ